jgi:hypothetical protein
MERRAGQGAGDAVHDLDAGDHQPAQLIQTGACTTALTSSASDRAIALTWQMALRAVDDAQEGPSCR